MQLYSPHVCTTSRSHVLVSLLARVSSPGIPFAWSDVTVSVGASSKGSEVTLLDNVSGYAKPGEMLAIMGPSGSGKSTLLDTLSGRKTVGNIRGTIKFGGFKPTQAFVRRYLGYVVQGDDTLLSLLTVEEMLRYTAELKLERSVSAEEKQEAVDGVIEVLGLSTCRHVQIGDRVVRGVSGGQAKRVSIGIALISNPRVLFLDEPTSGLDSFTANEVVSVVKSLATRGITVCATIHSPTPYAFGLFDSLLLLGSGRTMYFGPAQGAVAFVRKASSGFISEWDVHAASDSEFLSDVMMSAYRLGHENELVEEYEASGVREHAMDELERQLASTQDAGDDFKEMMLVRKATTTPSWWALLILFRYRTLKAMSGMQFYAQHVFPWLIQTVGIDCGPLLYARLQERNPPSHTFARSPGHHRIDLLVHRIGRQAVRRHEYHGDHILLGVHDGTYQLHPDLMLAR